MNSFTTLLPVVPKPGIPNLNGITISKEALASAVEHYNQSKEKIVILGIPKYQVGSLPKYQVGSLLNDIVGTASGIDWADESCQSYSVMVNLIDTPKGLPAKDMMKNKDFVIALNLMGELSNNKVEGLDTRILILSLIQKDQVRA